MEVKGTEKGGRLVVTELYVLSSFTAETLYATDEKVHNSTEDTRGRYQ